MARNRPIRIAGASGSASDRRHVFSSLAANHPNDPIDVIIGDWLSEANMTSLAVKKTATYQHPAQGQAENPAYEPTFLASLSPALKDVCRYGIKIAVNAGGSDTRALFEEVLKMVRKQGLDGKLKVAWVEGDDVLPVVKSSLARPSQFERKQTTGGNENRSSNEKGKTQDELIERVGDDQRFQDLTTGIDLQDWPFKNDIIGAQAYLGGLGIANAFLGGADIVVCGRVADASLVIGAAWWWHGWTREANLQELACAFVAGHLIECSTYVCGGNFSGFKDLEGGEGTGWMDIGFPITEIGKKGETVITKQKGTNGIVSEDTCTAQLLYEIQGPWYFNSDVTAVIDNIKFEQLSTNRVAVSGVKALPPPPTTKVGITAKGGYQAEIHWFLVGLDIEEKARMLEVQIRHTLGKELLARFSKLEFTLNGSAKEDADEQTAATVGFRVFAQAREEKDLAPRVFLRPIMDLIMCSYPGATFHLDFRQGIPRAVQEYFVCLMPQSAVVQQVHFQTGQSIEIDLPKETMAFPRQQPSMAISASTTAVEAFEETVRGPLGCLVHARSGDKGANANVGFWVRHADEYDWLRLLLSTEKMKSLLAKEYSGNEIDRFELPNLRAVHFLLHNHLDRGVSCSSTYDFLGKNVAEFLRSRYVDLPIRFLNRGKL